MRCRLPAALIQRVQVPPGQAPERPVAGRALVRYADDFVVLSRTGCIVCGTVKYPEANAAARETTGEPCAENRTHGLKGGPTRLRWQWCRKRK